MRNFMHNADVIHPAVPEPTKSSPNALPPSDETTRQHDRTAPDCPARLHTSAYGRRPDARLYLRLVPELALMAKHVVKAEVKRCARDAHKKANGSANTRSQRSPPRR